MPGEAEPEEKANDAIDQLTRGILNKKLQYWWAFSYTEPMIK